MVGLPYGTVVLLDCGLQGLLVARWIPLGGSCPAAERGNGRVQISMEQLQLRQLPTQLTHFFQVSLGIMM